MHFKLSTRIGLIIFIALTFILFTTNVWTIVNVQKRQVSANEAVAVLAKDVSEGLAISYEAITRDSVDWAMVYAGIIKAETSANAARLFAFNAKGTAKEVAVRLGEFQGILHYYGVSICQRIQNQSSSLNEENITKFTNALQSVKTFPTEIDLRQSWEEYLSWLDNFKESLN